MRLDGLLTQPICHALYLLPRYCPSEPRSKRPWIEPGTPLSFNKDLVSGPRSLVVSPDTGTKPL